MSRATWTLVVLGALILIFGLAIRSIPFAVIGSLLALAGVSIPRARRLELDLLRGKMVLERDVVIKAAHELAFASGMDEGEAKDVTQAVKDSLPPKVHLVASDSGTFVAAMPDGSSIVVPAPTGRTPTEQLLARILAEEEIAELLHVARQRRIDEQFPRTDETWAGSPESDGPPTTDFSDQIADEILGQVSDFVAPAKKTLIHPRGKGRSFRLVEIPNEGELRIGRSEQCDIVLADPAVSREHALIVSSEDGRATIRDLDSSNGVRVNGDLVGVRTLNDRDVISVSSYSLLYLAGSGSG
ncbi:MAG: FHA domain-containing protein [Solirubrobacterales bacterium]|nr:FHA domain-containing protein [Solirubrobacterales bacterium]